MEKRVFLGYLYDFYGELLNDHQKEIYSEYILDDLSLNEIAEEHGVSRQSVFDLVKRCTKSLEEYEDKLSLVARFLKVKDEIEEIGSLSEKGVLHSNDISDSYSADIFKKIIDISSTVTEEL